MNESKLNETFQALYPEPTGSEALAARLTKLAADADRRRAKARPVRHMVRLGLLAAGVALALLVAPHVAQAVRFLDAARLLESGRGVVMQEFRPDTEGGLKLTKTTWAVGETQRVEENGKITLWKDSLLYSWRPGKTRVFAQKGTAPLGGSPAQLLRMMAWESCMDLVRRESQFHIDNVGEVSENGKKLHRVRMSRGTGESGEILFDPATSLPVRIDTVGKDGKILDRMTLSVEPIRPELLALPVGASILDVDKEQSKFPGQALAKQEAVTIYDAAIAPNADLYLLCTEPIPLSELNSATAATSFDVEGYADLNTTLSQRPDGLKMVVLTPKRVGIVPPSTSLKLTLRLPDSYKPFSIQEQRGVPPMHHVSLELPLRKLSENAPEYAALPMLAWDADSSDTASLRQGVRDEESLNEAFKKKDFKEALRVTDRQLAHPKNGRMPRSQVWNQRRYILQTLGRKAEFQAADEEYKKEIAKEQQR
jgi:hypothetical protein